MNSLIGAGGLFKDGDWIETKDQDRDGQVRLVQLADLGDGRFLDKSDRSLTPEKAEELRCTILSKGDVLIARMPDPLGRACVFPGNPRPCVTAVDVSIVRPGPESVNPYWLMHFVNAPQFRGRAAALQSGSTRKRISRKNLSGLDLPVPPLSEQQRIASKIDELLSDLDAGVAALKRVKANLARYKASVLKAAVEGGLTEKWRKEHPDVEPASVLLERILKERRAKWEEEQLAKYEAKGQTPPKGWKAKYKEPEGPDAPASPDLPQGWCWASVGQLSMIQGGIQKQPRRAPKRNPFPYLRVANVLMNRLDLEELEYFELLPGELERLRLEPGDLLVVEGNGSRDQIGRSVLWGGQIPDCVHQNHIIRVRPKGVDSEFLNLYWNSPDGRKRTTEVSASTSGLYTLSVGRVAALPIPLPPVGEQAVIDEVVLGCLESIEEVLAVCVASLTRANRLRQSILAHAFLGRLVPQDRNDEPAPHLLERVRAERAARAASKPVRKPRGPRRTSKTDGLFAFVPISLDTSDSE